MQPHKSTKALLFTFILTILTVNALSQATISTNPGFLDAEEIERGESFEMSYFINVNTQENVTLDVEVTEPLDSRLWGGDIPINENQYSQEEISDWVDVPDQITVDPSEEVERDFGSGDEELLVGINVPQDAEPGDHAAAIRLNPVTGEDRLARGGRTYSRSTPEFMFTVPGDASRNVELTDLEAIRTGEDEVQLLSTFENTGTVTIRSRGGDADIVNSNDRREGTVSLGSFRVPPGETVQVDTTWSGEEGGQYSLDGTVDYITGQAYVGAPEAQFTIAGAIEDAIEVEGTQETGSESEDSTPLWIVIMVLVVLGVIMYSMDIDPFWIVLILGLLGLSTAILFTGIPNWLLILLVLGLVVFIYF